MNSINLICFLCLIIFLKGTRTSISNQASMLHQDIRSPGLLRLKNQAKLHLCWKQSIRRIRYPRVFQCNNGAEFKRDLTKLLEKHNVDIRRATTKYKHTIQPLWKPLTKSWQNYCLNRWMFKSYRTVKKYP